MLRICEFGIDKFDVLPMYSACLVVLAEQLNGASDILFVGNINKYVIIMHLICINHNNIINKFRQKKVVAVLCTCVLTSMQNFAAIGPFGAEI